jgi:copper chaperone CopZ
MATVLKVPDMHCEKCVERITNALNAAGLSFEVSLNDKTVTVNGDDASAAKAAEALDDIGFEAQR